MSGEPTQGAAGPKKERLFRKKAGSERLQVVLARHGIASRRGVVSMIEAGLVTVNDQVVREKGFRVDASSDRILVEGRALETSADPRKRYFVFYKPKGVMTTLQDPNAERTVADFFRDVPARLFPVGRLDRDTTGLLMMTNDGELAFRLTHPRFGVEKLYHARVEGIVTDAEKERLEKGVMLEEGMTAPCRIRIESRAGGVTVLSVILHEGKKRQIRRIFEKIGHYVLDLERECFGPLSLGDMRPGQRREISNAELEALRRVTGLNRAVRKMAAADRPASPRKEARRTPSKAALRAKRAEPRGDSRKKRG